MARCEAAERGSHLYVIHPDDPRVHRILDLSGMLDVLGPPPMRSRAAHPGTPADQSLRAELSISDRDRS
jgi:hypothetical protein